MNIHNRLIRMMESAARAGAAAPGLTVNSADFFVHQCKATTFILDVTAAQVNFVQLDVSIQARDLVSGAYSTFGSFTATAFAAIPVTKVLTLDLSSLACIRASCILQSTAAETVTFSLMAYAEVPYR